MYKKKAKKKVDPKLLKSAKGGIMRDVQKAIKVAVAIQSNDPNYINEYGDFDPTLPTRS